jgi:hypothetical protein
LKLSKSWLAAAITLRSCADCCNRAVNAFLRGYDRDGAELVKMGDYDYKEITRIQTTGAGGPEVQNDEASEDYYEWMHEMDEWMGELVRDGLDDCGSDIFEEERYIIDSEGEAVLREKEAEQDAASYGLDTEWGDWISELVFEANREYDAKKMAMEELITTSERWGSVDVEGELALRELDAEDDLYEIFEALQAEQYAEEMAVEEWLREQRNGNESSIGRTPDW